MKLAVIEGVSVGDKESVVLVDDDDVADTVCVALLEGDAPIDSVGVKDEVIVAVIEKVLDWVGAGVMLAVTVVESVPDSVLVGDIVPVGEFVDDAVSEFEAVVDGV